MNADVQIHVINPDGTGGGNQLGERAFVKAAENLPRADPVVIAHDRIALTA